MRTVTDRDVSRGQLMLGKAPGFHPCFRRDSGISVTAAKGKRAIASQPASDSTLPDGDNPPGIRFPVGNRRVTNNIRPHCVAATEAPRI